MPRYFMKPIARLLLFVVIIITLGALLVPRFAEIGSSLPWLRQHFSPGFLGVAVLCQAVVYVALAFVLAAPLRALGFALPFGFLFRLGATFLLANRALPGPAIMGAATLEYRLATQKIPPSAAHATAAVFYVVDYAAFLAIAAVALPVAALSGRPGLLSIRVLIAVLTLLAIAVIILVTLYRHPDRTERWAESLARKAGRLLRRADSEVWGTTARARVAGLRREWDTVTVSRTALPLALAAGLVMHLAEVATLAFATCAVGVTPSFLAAAAGYAAGNLGAIVSFLPGGAVLYEGSMIAALHALGAVPLPAAIAATLLYRLLSLLLPIPTALRTLTAVLQHQREPGGQSGG